MPKTQKSELKRKIDRIISAVEKKDLDSFSKNDVQILINERANFEREVSDLRSRLDELEETLNAIRTGEVDALVISGPKGESIYSLAGAEHPYRVMVETMGEGAITLSHDGTILFSNQSFSRLARIPLEKIVGTNITQYIGSEYWSEIQSVLDENKTARLELSLSHQDESVTPIYLSISPLQENKAGFSVVVTDLTHQKNEELIKKHAVDLQAEIIERKKAERELRASEQRFKSLVMDQTELICRFLPDGILTFVNPAFCKMAEMEQNEIIGNSLFMFLAEEDISRVIALMDIVTPEDPDRSIGLEIYVKDKVYWMNWNGRALFDSDGNLIEYQAVGRDETERKRAEMALRERAEELEAVLNSTPVPIFIAHNKDCTKITGNKAGYDLIRVKEGGEVSLYAPESVKARHYKGFKNGRELKSEEHPAQMACRGIAVKDYEYSIVFGDGDSRDMVANAIPLFDNQGISRGSITTLIDITERKSAEDALRKAKGELEDKVRERTADLIKSNENLLAEIEERKHTEKWLNESRKKLRAMASEIVIADERSRQHFATDLHDTVVQTIGAAKLRSQLIQDKIPEDAKPIYSELQNFISQSITQARLIMAEMSPPVLYELGFVPSLEWLTEQIENQHGLNIEFQAKSAPPMIHELQVMLFQSTRELLMNVVKHANAKTAVVKLSSYGSKIKIEVMDDGRGFEVRQAFRTDVSGGGFGLFSIRERLRHFGGGLNIRSQAGKGTKVIMTVQKLLLDENS